MENDKVKEAINKMVDAAGGDLVVVGERLFKQGIIPEDLIVTTDYTVFANDVNDVFEFENNKGIRHYFESSVPDAEYIEMLGFQKDSKDEIIKLLSKGSLYYDESADGRVKAGREFQKISPTNNNPVYSDGIKKISINNGGGIEMNLVLAVYLAIRYSEKPVAKALAIKIIDSASQKQAFKEAYVNATNDILYSMRASAMNGVAFNPVLASQILERYTSMTKLLYKNEIKETIELLDEIASIYNEKRKTDDDELNLLFNSWSVLVKTSSTLKNIIMDMDNVILSANETSIEYTRKMVYEEVFPRENISIKDYNSKLKNLDKIIEEAGFIKNQKIQRKQKGDDGKWLTDDNGEFIYSGKEVDKMVVNEKNPWVFDNKYLVGGTEKSATFKLTYMGYCLFKKLYEAALYCIEHNIKPENYDGFKITRESFEAEFYKENKRKDA